MRPKFAVIDFETTGLSPFKHHRVVEMAIVVVDSQGQLIEEWASLINPQRQVDATEIHGVSAKELTTAPKFEELTAEMSQLLQGCVLVSHNFAFDSLFLKEEFYKAGVEVPLSRFDGLCTMKLASKYLNAPSRSLNACCECAGVVLQSAHTAIEDARAAAKLLSYYLKSDEHFHDEWQDVYERAQALKWSPAKSVQHSAVTRQTAKDRTEERFLNKIVAKVPRSNLYPEANSYLEILDRALVDRHLSQHEIADLVSVANGLGLSSEQVLELHRSYLVGLLKIAYADGIFSDDERADLTKVAYCLCLETVDFDQLLKESEYAPMADCQITTLKLQRGDAIVFTGDSEGLSRDDLIYQAKMLGLRVTGAVSGKTKLLVSADPDSLSGKATKARELSVPIIGYDRYMELVKQLS